MMGDIPHMLVFPILRFAAGYCRLRRQVGKAMELLARLPINDRDQ